MPRLEPDEIEAVLTRPRALCRLATLSETGWPRLTPVRFFYADRTIFLTARESVRWLADIRRDGRVCLSVDEDDYERQKVTVTGVARVIHEPGDEEEWRAVRQTLRTTEWTGPTPGRDGELEWNWTEAYATMTWDEPRALLAVPLDEATVTSWRMPRVGELLETAWRRDYFRTEPRHFRVTHVDGGPDDWRVVEEP